MSSQQGVAAAGTALSRPQVSNPKLNRERSTPQFCAAQQSIYARSTHHIMHHAPSHNTKTHAPPSPLHAMCTRLLDVRTHLRTRPPPPPPAAAAAAAPLGLSHVHTCPRSSPGSPSAGGRLAMDSVRRLPPCRNVRTWLVTPSPHPVA
jgi:hypothetical protein